MHNNFSLFIRGYSRIHCDNFGKPNQWFWFRQLHSSKFRKKKDSMELIIQKVSVLPCAWFAQFLSVFERIRFFFPFHVENLKFVTVLKKKLIRKNGMWKSLNVGTFYLPPPVALSLCFKLCTSWSSALSHFHPKWKKKKLPYFSLSEKNSKSLLRNLQDEEIHVQNGS